jgi:hypothetical protein
MKEFLRRLAAFPHFLYLLPLFFVFHGYIENYPAVPLLSCVWLFVKYCLATVVLTGFFYFLIRSFRTASVMAFSTMAFHFFFGPAHDALKDAFPDSFLVKYSFILPVVLLLFIGLLFFFRKRKPAFPNLFQYLGLLLLVLITIDFFTAAFRFTKQSRRTDISASFSPCDTCTKPDIFLIIADSYSGRVALQEVFRFDNSAFENELRKRGFYIVDSSLSNYNYTPFTMASMFGMQYLEGLEGHDKSLNDRHICYRHLDQNPVTEYLGREGYEFKNFSIFKFAGQLPIMSTSFYRNGEDLIKAQTFLARIDRDIRYHAVTWLKIRSETERLTYGQLRLNKTLYQETWNEVREPTTTKPRFVYTHIEIPHYPYYFDKEGKPAVLEDLDEAKKVDTAKYLGYLQYGNKNYLRLIDHILTHAKKPPIIIFMSDHAFREYAGDSVDHKYHFMNFNSVLLPGGQYKNFYPGISTVNQFRVLFNAAFGQKLPLLKDSTSFLLE